MSPSLVRRFERFVADDRVEVEKYFEPFVRAMIISLGNETAYLLIDCTQAGQKCRTLFIGLAYHQTVLPVVWKTLKGKKGPVKGQFQQELLSQIYHRFQHCRRVIVLGDAEFSNEPVINCLRPKNWGFVFHFQSNYRLQLEPDGPWLSALSVYQAADLKPGQVKHWPIVGFTQAHQIPNLTMTVHWEVGCEEPLCLISNLSPSDQPHLLYDRRYWVETLFGNIVINQADQVDRADRRDVSLFQLGWRWLYRLLALDRLEQLEILFRWDFKLPPAGFQPAN